MKGVDMPEPWPWPDDLDALVAAPKAVWSEPLPPHTLENADTRPIHLVSVELKR